jgi:hypothetical protein
VTRKYFLIGGAARAAPFFAEPLHAVLTAHIVFRCSIATGLPDCRAHRAIHLC